LLGISAVFGTGTPDVVRDAVQHDVVPQGLSLDQLVDGDGFGGDAGRVHRVDAFGQGAGEVVFLAEEDSDFFHGAMG
jgi:hypothetical protein